MSIIILEALQNAEYNLRVNGLLGLSIAESQLHIAITLLEKGYDLYDEMEPLLAKYNGDVECIPQQVEG